jgi:hypothetical protein
LIQCFERPARRAEPLPSAAPPLGESSRDFAKRYRPPIWVGSAQLAGQLNHLRPRFGPPLLPLADEVIE